MNKLMSVPGDHGIPGNVGAHTLTEKPSEILINVLYRYPLVTKKERKEKMSTWKQLSAR